MSENFVAIVTYPTRMQADIACGLLEEADIPFVINSDLSAILGAGMRTILPKGASVAVPESAVSRAKEILASVGLLEPEDDDAGPTPAA